MNPIISVIVANYNGELYLADALHSILSQSLTQLEILLVDDMSTDRSLEIAKAIATKDARLRILCLPENRGPAAARNYALKASRGAWVAMVDSDDFIHPERLRRLLDVAEADQADIVADDQLVFDNDNQTGPRRLLCGVLASCTSWITTAQYIHSNRLFSKSPSLGYLKPLIRTSLLVQHHIRYNENLKNAEDYDLILHLLVRGARFRLLPELLYFYRRHGASISHRLSGNKLREMVAADFEFRNWAGPEAIASLRAALDARLASIHTAKAVEASIAGLKARSPIRVLAALLAWPGAIPIMARLATPAALLARLRRRTPQASRTTGQHPSQPTICVLSRQRMDLLKHPSAITSALGAARIEPVYDPPKAWPFVTIVVPTLNEARYIESCLTSLVSQCVPGNHEILVMDGGSTDNTCAIVASFCERHSAVVLLNNPQRLQSAALNLAAYRAAPSSTVMIRADAHAHYAPDFVKNCVSALLETGATSVVVPMHTRALSGAFLQLAIAAAQSSRLGNGGAAHRAKAVSGFVEHGHHAAFDLGFFRSIGGYDESFTHNEDAELDVRARKAGGGVWMCAEVPVVYYPRNRLDRLALQYYRHGGGRARTLRKHHLRPRLRQVAPVGVLAGCIAGVAAAPFMPADASLALIYPAACLAWGIAEGIRQREPRLAVAGLALMTMHLSWAVGFLAGLGRVWPVAKQTSQPASSSIRPA
jgi:succinoglycan biosynthesis protein ExoA